MDPRLECDIVMAGGVTSGIVYPGAVAEIAKDYRFRSIGGTSVGAIAAAVTAAAEFGRWSGNKPDAFTEVAKLHSELAATEPDGQTRLLHLFTAERQTRSLLAMALSFFSGRTKGRILVDLLLSTLRQAPIVFFTGSAFLIGLAPAIFLFNSGHPINGTFAALAALGLTTLVWAGVLTIVFLKVWFPAMRRNYYGLCIGKGPSPGPDGKVSGHEHLTDWMHRQIQSLAGLGTDGNPLTFGNLWSLSIAESEPDLSTGERKIDLAMITSDLSRNRLAQLPFLEFPTELYAEISVLSDFFPASVVAWIVNHQGVSDSRISHSPAFVRLPRPQDLPVLVATRMSLSFPVLLSAIPLLAPNYRARPEDKQISLQRVWFSDGGLVSNFPIHFFDSPMPSRPTFCLNLVDFDVDVSQSVAGGAPSRRRQKRSTAPLPTVPPPRDPAWDLVSMTKGNYMPGVPFSTFDRGGATGPIGLVRALLSTARGWSDNQLLLAPGVRERVVNVGLREDEGGLNLAMGPDIIEDLNYRGRAAGRMIAARFDPTPGPDPKHGTPKINSFPNHRWVRFRNTMAAIEDLLRRLARSRHQSDAAASNRHEPTIDAMVTGNGLANIGYHPLPTQSRGYYRFVARQLERAGYRLAQALAADPYKTFDVPMGTKSSAKEAPRPKMRYMVRPIVAPDPRAQRGDDPGQPPLPP